MTREITHSSTIRRAFSLIVFVLLLLVSHELEARNRYNHLGRALEGLGVSGAVLVSIAFSFAILLFTGEFLTLLEGGLSF